MKVDFYHLARSPIERVLPAISEKVLAGGGRLLVVAGDDQLARLEEQLWTCAPDAFLPHGRDNEANQPILLASEPEAKNGAANIAIADGKWRDEALTFERTFYFFDSGALDEAREVWRALSKKEGVEPRYWKQDERGRWVQGP